MQLTFVSLFPSSSSYFVLFLSSIVSYAISIRPDCSQLRQIRSIFGFNKNKMHTPVLVTFSTWYFIDSQRMENRKIYQIWSIINCSSLFFSFFFLTNPVFSLYLSISSGIIECKEPIEVVSYKIGVCKVSPKGKECMTIFQKLGYNGKTSVVLCKPKTGRMHQIRVHLQFLGE